jgi:hypothetical protein
LFRDPYTKWSAERQMNHAAHIAATPRLSRLAALLVLASAAFPSAAGAQSLCTRDEVDYFSCPVKGGKVLSICSNLAEVDTTEPGHWVQYRFGTPRRIELAYPREKKESLSRFEGHVFDARGERKETSELRFINGTTYYSVSLSRSPAKGTRNANDYAGAVGVGRPGAKLVSINCSRVDGDWYFRRFTDLNYELIRHARASGNVQDMLRDFRLQTTGKGR